MTQVRQLLLCKPTAVVHRVVFIDESRTWLMPLGKGSEGAWPEAVSSAALAKDLRDAVYGPVKEGVTRALTKKADEHAEHVHAVYATALTDTFQLLHPRGRANALKALQKTNAKINAKSFYKVVRRWLSGGCVVTALAALWVSRKPKLSTDGVKQMNYQGSVSQVQAQSVKLMESGYEPPKRTDYTKKKKQPRKRSMCERPTKFEVDRNALRVFLHYYLKHKTTKGSKLPARHEEMLDEVFATPNPTGVGSTRWPDYAIPSFRQFEDWYYVMTTFRDRRISRSGESDWNLNGRSTLQQSVTEAYTAGVVGSIDATVWPVELVTDDEFARLIGPPVVFRVRDRDYGMLLGIGISLESASWMSAGSAIANCNEPKVQFCAAAGVTIDLEDWNIEGLPGIIEADCGETHNSKPNRFISITKTDLRNLQAGRGDLKAGVEGDWNVLQVALCEMTPSAIISQHEETTKAKWRMKARMTLREFKQMLIIQELKKMQTVRPHLKLPVEMTGAGVDTSAVSMWNWSVEHRGGGLRTFDHDAVRLSLLEIRKGSVTPDGVLFRGLLYTADELAVVHAYEQARATGRRTLDIAHDQRLTDNVYIVVGDPEHPTRYVVCSLNTKRVDQAGLAGKTFREVEQLRDVQKSQNGAKTRDTQPKMSKWTAQQKAITEAAIARVDKIRAESGVSHNALENDRATARNDAKNASSPADALRPIVDAAPPSALLPPQLPAAGVDQPSQRPKRASGLAARASALQTTQA